VHTVKVWRTKKDGGMFPGSEYTSQYFVGSKNSNDR